MSISSSLALTPLRNRFGRSVEPNSNPLGIRSPQRPRHSLASITTEKESEDVDIENVLESATLLQEAEGEDEMQMNIQGAMGGIAIGVYGADRGGGGLGFGAGSGSTTGGSAPVLAAERSVSINAPSPTLGETEKIKVEVTRHPKIKRYMNALLYGLINSVILIPVIISFAQIIFRDSYFTDKLECAQCMPYLVKLVILSSTVHQLCFTLKSSLTFAIGQVQDAGLIFLSSMASSIVTLTRERSASHEEILATVLCWIAISTALLGVGLYLTGLFKLASLVQYLPMPVVSACICKCL